MDCVFTGAAAADLEEIGDHIARDDPRAALRFIDALRDRCHRIARMPNAAPLRPVLGTGIRLVPFGTYLILYAQRDGCIVIERIVHGARDIDASILDI